MKITSVETFVVRALAGPWMFCAVRTDEGITGYSEMGSGPYPRGLVGIVRDLAELVVGKDPSGVDRLYFDMCGRFNAKTNIGVTALMGVAGIELALWDIKGKALGQPVYRLLGGPFRDRQRVYTGPISPPIAHTGPIRPSTGRTREPTHCSRGTTSPSRSAWPWKPDTRRSRRTWCFRGTRRRPCP